MAEKVPGDSDTPITHDQARDAANRLINSFFDKQPGARVGIPARPGYDDDLILMQYIREQRAIGAALAAEREAHRATVKEANRLLDWHS